MRRLVAGFFHCGLDGLQGPGHLDSDGGEFAVHVRPGVGVLAVVGERPIHEPFGAVRDDVLEPQVVAADPGREFERRFSAEHGYRHAGDYEITITLRRANRSLAVASARVNVRPGLGDVSAP